MDETQRNDAHLAERDVDGWLESAGVPKLEGLLEAQLISIRSIYDACAQSPEFDAKYEGDRVDRYYLMLMGAWAVDTGRVNIQDLLSMRAGAIIRCSGPPNDCIVYLGNDDPTIGCVGGMISDD